VREYERSTLDLESLSAMTYGLAAASLLVVPVIVAGVTAWALSRTRFTLLQGVLWVTAYLITRLLWRAKLPRQLPFRDGEGGVIVCNHRSSIDPFFVQCCASRPVHWMVAREYCELPVVRWLLRTCEVIPVGRGGIDTHATKLAIRLAARGELVGMLPEGRINRTGEFMLPVRPGAVLVALRARVPILPCYIEGAPYGGTAWSPFLMPARVRLVLGQPIDLAEYYERASEDGLVPQLALRIAREIARLAGREDFEPKLAGRRWKSADDDAAGDARSSSTQ
jgi:1-acyl-sn-glycerol-3-phosphate acyltransferase